MANKKISELDAFSGNVQNDDLFEIVDVSDTSMAPTGTNKKVTWQEMKGDLNDIYLRLNGANGPLTGNLAVTGDLDITGAYKINGVPITSGGGIPDAPTDGTTYGRNNAAWVPVPDGSTQFVKLDGTNGPLTGQLDTLSLLPDQATAQVGTEQAPYQEVNARRIKMPSDPGGYWALEKSADPGNVLNFVRNDGAGDTVPYTLNPTGTPTSSTDLATKAYVDSNAGGARNNDWFITKAPGNNGGAEVVEVGDKVIGWLGNFFLAGLVLNVPITAPTDLNLAQQGQIIP